MFCVRIKLRNQGGRNGPRFLMKELRRSQGRWDRDLRLSKRGSELAWSRYCAYKPTFVPRGDQAKAIEGLAQGIRAGYKHQTLLGVTGSGKTFTMAGVIEAVQRPTLVIAHNKTLAAQLCSEFREFFSGQRL